MSAIRTPTKRWVVLTMVMLLAGAGCLVKYFGAPSETPPGEAAEQQALAMGLPSLDRSASILGPDANANGIRDDIEAWIAARNDRTAEQKAAMMWYAKSLQAEMAAPRTPEAALGAVIAKTRAAECLSTRFSSFDDYVNTAQLIRDYTRNTPERVREFMALDRLLGGQSWSLPNGDTCGDLK